MTIGLLGGTFDPVHDGHLDVARAARAALGMEQVWFIPARHPSHRTPPTASAAHRFAMVALAVAGDDALRVCDVEMESTAPSYTIDTLARLEARFPWTERPCFITGADAFLDIRTWRAHLELLDRSHFVVVSRPGVPVAGLRAALPELAGRMIETPCTIPSTASIFLVEAATAPVSATGVRRALATGGALDGVPQAVADYAMKHDLYTGRVTGETSHE